VLEKIKSVKPLPGFRLEVEFQDGKLGIVSMQKRLFGPVFEPLKDPSFFEQVSVDEFGAVCWPNGADIAPEAVLEEAAPYQA